MSGSLNKVLVLGNVGGDPTVRQVSSGAVVNLRLATNERWKDKDGKSQEKTEWHSITVWGKLAEIVQNYVKKGSKILVEGRLQTDKTEDGRYFTSIVASNVTFMGDTKDDNAKPAVDGMSSVGGTVKAPF